MWRGLPCGEKELDWEIAYIPSAGRKGLVAKRAFAADERVFVERMHYFKEIDFEDNFGVGACPKGVKEAFRALHPPGMDSISKFDIHGCPISELNGELVLGVNLSNVYHACRPNCEWVFDATDLTQPTVLLVTGRPIAAGEEMTVTYTWTIGISANYTSPAVAAAALAAKWGIVCPPDCSCKDATVMGKVARIHRLEGLIREQSGTGRIADALRSANEILQIATDLELSSIQRVRAMNFVIDVGIARRATAPRALRLMAEKHALTLKVFGPKAAMTLESEEQMKRPTAHPNHFSRFS